MPTVIPGMMRVRLLHVAAPSAVQARDDDDRLAAPPLARSDDADIKGLTTTAEPGAWVLGASPQPPQHAPTMPPDRRDHRLRCSRDVSHATFDFKYLKFLPWLR